MFILMSALFIIACYKVYSHELKQEAKIKNLMLELELLNADTDVERNEFVKNIGLGGLNVLVLGNSITRHGIVDYWWNEIGMAASKAERDYYHQVIDELSNMYNNINSYAYNFSQWEISDYDRAQTIKLIDPLLLPQIDMIILQLGENVSNTDTLKTDFDYLITYIKGKCPDSDIIIVGNFWKNIEVENIKQLVSDSFGLKYVSLEDLWGKKEFFAGMGTIVYDAEGKAHTIEHSGVAKHPGDKGMSAIADKIIECIKEKE